MLKLFQGIFKSLFEKVCDTLFNKPIEEYLHSFEVGFAQPYWNLYLAENQKKLESLVEEMQLL